MTPRNDWSVAVDKLTPEQKRDLEKPDGLFDWMAAISREHARWLLRQPRVIDLDAERKARRP